MFISKMFGIILFILVLITYMGVTAYCVYNYFKSIGETRKIFQNQIIGCAGFGIVIVVFLFIAVMIKYLSPSPVDNTKKNIESIQRYRNKLVGEMKYALDNISQFGDDDFIGTVSPRIKKLFNFEKWVSENINNPKNAREYPDPENIEVSFDRY